MWKGYIFDLDGVIVFTDKYHYSAWKRVADEEGIYFDEQINNRLRGVSRMESLDIILELSIKHYSDSQKTLIAERKNGYYKEFLQNMSPADVSDEVKQTLTLLKEGGAKLAIGSSSKNAGFILNQVKLTDFFDAISDGNNITKSKPDPEVFIKAAQMLNLLPNDCVVIEDAFAGIDAALSGGFAAAAIGDAAMHPQKTFMLSTFSDLRKI